MCFHKQAVKELLLRVLPEGHGQLRRISMSCAYKIYVYIHKENYALNALDIQSLARLSGRICRTFSGTMNHLELFMKDV